MKKINVVEDNNKKKIEDINREIAALEERIEKLEEKRAELVKKELEDKIVIVHNEIVVEERIFRPRSLFDIWY